MRLTRPLQHMKRFWWGKGWGHRPIKDNDAFLFREQWKAKSKVKLQVVQQTLPEGVVPIDPNKFVKEEMNKEYETVQDFTLPWPYSKRPIKGTPEDPSYQDQEALVFERNKRLLEPINLPLYFTNSILESGLPKSIREFRDNVQLSPEFVALCKRRLNWGLNNDSTLMKLPLDREFPYLDQTPPRVFGTPIGRKELSLLRTLYDLAQEWTSQHFGFNPNVFLQRVSHLNCVLPVDREEKLALFDLQSDFVTLLSSTNQKEASITPFDSNFVSSTSNKKLTSLAPISWELAFTPKHFYNTNYEFEIPAKSSIQTIFLSNQSLRLLDVDNYRGRCILFCYGMAAQQAKFKYQKELAEIQLEKPIQVQCVYTDPKEFQIGYVLLQLNTLDLDNSQIRNQVWFSEPRSVITNTADAIRDLITIQSRGIFEDAFSPTRM